MLDNRDPRDDQDLLIAWRAGEQRAGSRLFKRHAPAVARFFRNKLTSEDDMSDLQQETFLALLQSKEIPVRMASYLRATANNVLCKHFRKKYKRQNERIDFSVVCVKDLEPSSMSSIIMRRHHLQAFVNALRAIPIDDQVLLELKYFDGLASREIGEILGLPGTTVSSRVQRARERLRQRIELLLTAVRAPIVNPLSDDNLDEWASEIRRQAGMIDPPTPD